MLKPSLESLLKERILVLDGATGTALQDMNLTAEDFGGEDLYGCNENLVLSKPEAIEAVHNAYLEAGADIIETNTFGGVNFVLAEYELEDKVVEINTAAVRIALKARDKFSSPEKPRYVAGAMGPTTKALAVTGGISFDDMAEAYFEQVACLINEGVDFLLLETAMDTLNLKAAYIGILKAFETTGKEIPLAISITIETMGTMLAGQAVEALYASIEHMNPVYIGLNCATGPDLMRDHVRSLSEISRFPISVVPNAGIPDPDGNYPEGPEDLAASLKKFVDEGWVNILGGCCGTTPKHIKEVAKVCEAGKRRDFTPKRECRVSGIEPLIIEDVGRPYIVGERTNVIGSRAFKRLIEEEKFDEAAEIARKQVKAGAHIIDVCLSNPDRDEVADTIEFYNKVSKMVKVPFMVDSQDPAVVEAAFKLIQGKCILNSVNLEDGEKAFEELLPLVKKYGAAVVVGCIRDEMAVEPEEKLDVAIYSHKLITEKYGIPEEDIIFDPLVFPCGTGDENYFGSGWKTIEGVKLIDQKLPNCKTTLGLSNVSFGLPGAGRETLNSVFLHHCVKAGLDSAIINSEKIVRFSEITEEEMKLCDDLLWYNLEDGNDPIANFTAYFRDKKVEAKVEVDRSTLTIEKKLEINIVGGTKEYLIENLDEALKKWDPLGVINNPLMAGMGIVGKLFNNNELIVAEVLQSAEVMKTAVSYLEDFMEAGDQTHRGVVILATVKGDVHDIGKNLVDIILSNNGFKVIDLGIKCISETLIAAIKEHKPDMVGLSGLLVKSAQQMVATASDFKASGINIPILVGGAALTDNFTASKIALEYDGPVIYCKDAMTGLDVANNLVGDNKASFLEDHSKAQEKTRYDLKNKSKEPKRKILDRIVYNHDDIKAAAPHYDPIIIEEKFETIWPFINKQMLYGTHLGLKGNIKNLLKSQDEKTKKIVDMVEKVRQEVIEKNLITAKCVARYFKVRSENDDLIILDNKTEDEIQRFRFPRQTRGHQMCLTDFVNPGAIDHVAFFVLTCGSGIAELGKQRMDEGNYFESHGFQAIALECAEGFAEFVHQKLRAEWGIPDSEDATLEDLFKLHYTGARVSFGYPACPRLEDQAKLWEILKPTEAIGVELTEEFMMVPEASVSALVFHHPQAGYFRVSEEEMENFKPL
ncbi:methionine synthase [Candidatus Marinamargulisbacteria bacterium SCGC AAA071-K20]|nr:methionine synthase [Candidatus Marinamargulisbacteria bacterium SCGC AAA071-K20]